MRILFRLCLSLYLLSSLPVMIYSCKAQQAAQGNRFTRQDTLKGSITPERAWWDVLEYEITIEPDFTSKTIRGKNILTCIATDEGQTLQIDLQAPLRIFSVRWRDEALTCTQDGNAWHVRFSSRIQKGTTFQLEVSYSGKPHEARNPPWDGGWIWERDRQGKPWMTVACESIGGSAWYPCKDHQSDEPDSAILHILVPDTLTGVGNGRLKNISQNIPGSPGKTMYTWEVKSPINNYNIVPYIGDYIHWSDIYDGEKGKLDLGYWVLSYNEEKAREQFTQVKQMMKCFEYWFGPYPFYADSYKLVESPYLGMEHQSAIAYGNQFMNGYRGRDLSGSGWGLKWDFIIVHESGHEWFGNSITTKDIADMWVHEGFTNYSEVLYTECLFGKKAGEEYCIGLRRNIRNDIPVIAPYGVNKEGSGDMYYKASNLIHMIRQIMDDDEKFRDMLRGMNRDFFQQTVTGDEIEQYISRMAGRDLKKIFDQYLRSTTVPDLEYTIENGILRYRWSNCVKGFDMPVRVLIDHETWLYPSESWQTMPVKGKDLQVDPNFYVGSRKM